MEKIEVGEVQIERMDDIPVIFGHLQKMHIQAVFIKRSRTTVIGQV